MDGGSLGLLHGKGMFSNQCSLSIANGGMMEGVEQVGAREMAGFPFPRVWRKRWGVGSIINLSLDGTPRG